MVEPYIHIMICHLSYAMVHLNSGIQSDSLLIMNILLNHSPSLVAQNSNVMLKNYIALIARKVKYLNNIS